MLKNGVENLQSQNLNCASPYVDMREITKILKAGTFSSGIGSHLRLEAQRRRIWSVFGFHQHAFRVDLKKLKFPIYGIALTRRTNDKIRQNFGYPSMVDACTAT